MSLTPDTTFAAKMEARRKERLATIRQESERLGVQIHVYRYKPDWPSIHIYYSTIDLPFTISNEQYQKHYSDLEVLFGAEFPVDEDNIVSLLRGLPDRCGIAGLRIAAHAFDEGRQLGMEQGEQAESLRHNDAYLHWES